MANPEAVRLAAADLPRHTSFSVAARPQRTDLRTLPGGVSLGPRLARTSADASSEHWTIGELL